MKLESLNSPKFEPLSQEKVSGIRGGEYETYSGPGNATVNGRDFRYANDCNRWTDGHWYTTYALYDGSGVSVVG